MTITMLKGKIHRAVVTQAELNYVGSITVDPVLMEAAGIYEYEKVQVVDVESGSRLENLYDSGRAWKRNDLLKRCGSQTGTAGRSCDYHGIL